MIPWVDRVQGSRKLGALCADKIAEDGRDPSVEFLPEVVGLGEDVRRASWSASGSRGSSST